MIDQLMIAARRFTPRSRPDTAQPPAITQQTLRRLVGWLSTSTANQRRRLPGLDPQREDLVLPTGLALLAWMEGCKISTLKKAAGSLREGLVADDVMKVQRKR